MDSDHVNADAGPSRSFAPRTSLDTTPSRSTPPATPAKVKRRSWFGFASPSHLMTPSSSSGGRRKSKAEGEEVEMLDAGEVLRRSEMSARDGQHDSVGGGGGSSLRPARTSTDRPPSLQYEATGPSAAHGGQQGHKEELTIDGQVEGTVKKKSMLKRRSRQKEEFGEVVRMADLSGSSTRQNSVRKPYDPGGDPLDSSVEAPRVSRIAARTRMSTLTLPVCNVHISHVQSYRKRPRPFPL
jgi:hypothetical protein